jgi:hypothetical protein
LKFRTEIQAEKFPFEISYKSKILFLGSCFSDNISQKLIESGFSAYANPFGVLYNPVSIKNGLDILINQKVFTEQDLIEDHGLFHSFSHHGSFSESTAESTLNKINKATKDYSERIKTCDLLFITFGTSFVYQHKETKDIVSNCHKLPAKAFDRFSLSIEDITKTYTILLTQLKAFNPKLKVVFTVSPIRHWKDGAHENQLSKARLLLAVESLEKTFDFVHYYPAYELIMDDLRDYRFYTEDLVHLNNQAVNYIYEHFQDSFFSDATKRIESRVLKLKQALNHRPFNTETKEHQSFVKSTKEKIEQLKQEFPEINI